MLQDRCVCSTRDKYTHTFYQRMLQLQLFCRSTCIKALHYTLPNDFLYLLTTRILTFPFISRTPYYRWCPLTVTPFEKKPCGQYSEGLCSWNIAPKQPYGISIPHPFQHGHPFPTMQVLRLIPQFRVTPHVEITQNHWKKTIVDVPVSVSGVGRLEWSSHADAE